RFSLAMSEGFVVTPSTTPSATPSLISAMFAVSRKIFMTAPLYGCSSRLYRNARAAAHARERAGVARHPADDVDGAGRPDLVAATHRGRTEENTKGLAGRPVAEIAERHRLHRRLRGEREADVEVDLVAPG